MKKITTIIATIFVIIYLLIGLGIDRYNEYQASKKETFIESLRRDNDRYLPSHFIRIVFWPLYI